MKNNTSQNRKGQDKGFTLVETLIAIATLVIACLGPLSIAVTGIRNAVIARDQMTAFYLAQEGVEAVRHIRDTNGLAGREWLTNLDDCLGSNGCTVNSPSVSNLVGSIAPCGASGCPKLRVNSSDYYNYGNGPDSPYTRTIRILNPANGDPNRSSRRVVEVTVSWRTGVYQGSVVLNELLMM